MTSTVPTAEVEEGPPALATGHRLTDDLVVLDHLRRGDALDVYTVWSTARASTCVAKLVRPDRAHEDRVVQRLLHEGRLLLSLSHPHLVRAYDLFESGPVLVLETLVGETLEGLLDRQTRRLRLVEVAVLGTQLCSALHCLHGTGQLHLDIKPDNVMAAGGLLKLFDLSLARPPGTAPRGVGTREYLSPEQATGAPLTAAADVWALGLTLYEATTGVQPFWLDDEPSRDASGRTRYVQLEERAAPVRSLRRGLPAAFTDLVDACLHPDPVRRPRLEVAAAVLARLAPDPLGLVDLTHPLPPDAPAV
jgi:eukaryotic-like serine/threonine-protein kinase